MTDGILSLNERLAIVYERLDALPPATGAREAFEQLAETLDSVEDEYSGVPKNPNSPLKFDGRMYAPRPDYVTEEADGRMIAMTRGNVIYADPDGTLTITSRRTGETVYRREGGR